jgi:hypothetical protein
MRCQQLRVLACPHVGKMMPKLTHLSGLLSKVIDIH